MAWAHRRPLDREPLGRAPDALVVVQSDGVIVDANEMAAELFGVGAAQLIGRSIESLVPPDWRETHAAHRAAYLRTPRARPMGRGLDLWAVRGDGTEFPVDVSLGPLNRGCALAAVRDMTEQHDLVVALGQSESRFRCIFESSPVPVVIVDDQLHFVDANAAALDLFGHDRAEFLTLGLSSVTPPEDSNRYEHMLAKVLDGVLPIARLEKRFVDRDGRLVWAEMTIACLEGANPAQLLITILDITARKQVDADLQHRALYDPLTGLANRELVLERLSIAVARTTRAELVGLIFVDLDHFKEVNDEHGHPAGDAVLVETAKRLAAACRPYDTAGRLGGDEFVLVLDGLGRNQDVSVEAIERVAERVRVAARAPIQLSDDVQVAITASVGYAITSENGPDVPLDLLNRADRAMYRAKHGGRDRVVGDRSFPTTAGLTPSRAV